MNVFCGHFQSAQLYSFGLKRVHLMIDRLVCRALVLVFFFYVLMEFSSARPSRVISQFLTHTRHILARAHTHTHTHTHTPLSPANCFTSSCSPAENPVPGWVEPNCPAPLLLHPAWGCARVPCSCPGCRGTEPSAALGLDTFVLSRPGISSFFSVCLFCLFWIFPHRSFKVLWPEGGMAFPSANYITSP